MSGGLEGKRIVVTGSSFGIGRAIAVALVKEGARIVVNGSGTGTGGLGDTERALSELVDEVSVLDELAATVPDKLEASE
jgi:NAD(P)-dependent dehydrogenase (short-subunit alcohol dehydrogenase family)